MSRRVDTSRAVRLFSRFHGRKPSVVLAKSLRVPGSLILLGQAISIVYKCDKLNGGGDGTVAEYAHDFDTPVGLYMDESGKGQLYLIGSRLKVTDAGIEN